MNPDKEAKLDQVIHLFEAISTLPAKKVNLADKGWFTIKEAMTWSSLSRRFLSGMMAEGRLWHKRFGGRGDIRIPKAHLDAQIVLGFPVLDMPPEHNRDRTSGAQPAGDAVNTEA